jgi:hypothetical protein
MTLTSPFCIVSIIDAFGDIGPFRLAIALTVITMVLILFWDENYGHSESGESVTSITASIKESYKVIAGSPAIICLGLSQAFFEGAIYTFGELPYILTYIHGYHMLWAMVLYRID